MAFREEIIVIENEQLKIGLHPLGARLVYIHVKRKDGTFINVLETYDDLEPYLDQRKYSGAIIGPFANRIKNGNFTIGKNQYQLEQNEGNNSLHSGTLAGLHAQHWSIKNQEPTKITFQLNRQESDDGFPGDRSFYAIYTLSNNFVWLEFLATTTADTHINMTSHGYFNLDASDHLDDHQFQINAQNITELDPEKIPTGDYQDVTNSHFDLNEMQAIDPTIYDHNFIIADKDKVCATAYSTKSKLRMTVKTDQPGLQFYSGNKKFFCFETQHFADSPNQPSFPSTLVKGGQQYKRYCTYGFRFMQ